MKLRTIPFGYIVHNGEIEPHPEESIIVRRIFAEYVSGAPLLKIAQTLAAERVEFLPGRSDWNKNRVKRILEDTRYLGRASHPENADGQAPDSPAANRTYPALADEDMFHRAQTVKDSKNNQMNKSGNPFRLPCPVECSCGTKMKRRHDDRRKASQELWRCQNPDCGRIININDTALMDEITRLLNWMIQNPSCIQAENRPEADPPLEVRRLQNEVNRRLDQIDMEKEEVKRAIFSLAQEKYRQIDNQNSITQMLRAEFEKQTPLSHFSPELCKTAIRRIRFDEDGTVMLILQNEQIIRKEKHDADSSSTDRSDTSC